MIAFNHFTINRSWFLMPVSDFHYFYLVHSCISCLNKWFGQKNLLETMIEDSNYHLMWRAISILDTFCGAYILHDSKLSSVKKFGRFMSFGTFYTFMAVLVYNTYAYRKNLVLLILSGSAVTIYMTVNNGIINFLLRKEDYMTVVVWCKKILEQNTPRMVKARAMSYKYVKINIGLCYYLGTTCTLLPTVVGFFLPEEIYPNLRHHCRPCCHSWSHNHGSRGD